MKTENFLASIATIAVLVVGSVGIASAASSTEVVTLDDMQNWLFREEVPSGTGQMVEGPATPPLGSGSAELTVDSTGRMLLEQPSLHRDTPLSEFSELNYSTYRISGSSALVPSLQINVDTDLTDSDDNWQGRLVYEPYYTETVNTGEWQTWDTLVATGSGNWWFSGAPGNSECPISNPCTWDEVLAEFPNAGVRDADYSGVLFKAGGPWASGFVGNVDDFTVAVSGDSTTYDFEPVLEPETKEDCKDGGWATFNAPREFKNQGDCVSYVASDGKAQGNPSMMEHVADFARGLVR